MDEKILELIFELKKKCIINDDVFMKEANLSQAEYHLFIAISDCDRINSSSLSNATDLSLSRISRVIDKFVNRGYLHREVDSKDRRAIKLELTTDGEDLMNRILIYREECERRIIDKVSEEELVTIKQSFNTVLNHL